MGKPWLLDDFDAALKQLDSALSGPIGSDLERAGCIQYFEFTFELAWKSIRAVADELGQPDCLSPKACLKQAFSNKWIGDEDIWLKMLDSRNRMSHTYRAKDALKVFESLKAFLPEFHRLLEELKKVGKM
jgi:nucleotidyltransferase substrate binding protein (TIGR01987 family)